MPAPCARLVPKIGLLPSVVIACVLALPREASAQAAEQQSAEQNASAPQANEQSVDSAAAPDAPPLSPRFETPSEVEERERTPRFQKPSELAAEGASTDSAASEASAQQIPPVAGAGFCATVPTGAARAYFRDLTLQNFARPPCSGTGRGTFYGRGFFSYLSDGFDQWSGAELGWDGTLARDFAAGASFHHEFRERRASLFSARMSGRLYENWHGFVSVAAGNSTYYSPVTALDVEVGKRFDAYPEGYFALGSGTARFSQDRQNWYLTARHQFWLRERWGADARLGMMLFWASEVDARVQPLLTLTGSYGIPDRLLLELRFAASRAHDYLPDEAFANTEDRWSIDASFGIKHWVDPNYGYFAKAEYGTLFENYHRVGLDFGVFFHAF